MVLTIAKTSNTLDNFIEKICVKVKVIPTKITKATRENRPIADDITKNQRENPNVTAIDLNRGEDNSILYRINKRDKSSLC